MGNYSRKGVDNGVKTNGQRDEKMKREIGNDRTYWIETMCKIAALY